MTPQDAWTSGDAYESYVGRWSRPVARRFLQWLSVDAASWLDVGCGTGALARSIVDVASPASVVGIDPSRAFLAHARAATGGPSRFLAADAHALPFGDAIFDACVSGLVLNFLKRPEGAVSEMRRAVRRSGTVAAYVWDYAVGMEMMRAFWDAATSLDPGAHPLDEGRRFPLADPDALAEVFRDAGLQRVDTEAIEIETPFADFDDLWRPFLGGQGPAPGYVASLSDARRGELADRLRGELQVAADGTITLRARAWAVRGTS